MRNFGLKIYPLAEKMVREIWLTDFNTLNIQNKIEALRMQSPHYLLFVSGLSRQGPINVSLLSFYTLNASKTIIKCK